MPAHLQSTKTGIISAILLVLAASGILGTEMVHAASPLALDGLGVNTACQASGCVAQLLTTSQGYDVIILVAECGAIGCDASIVSIIDSSGLTFTQRVFYSLLDSLWEYYSRAMSPLKSDNITVLFSSSLALTGMQVLAIHGANTQAIFDLNRSIPAEVPCPGPSCGDCTAEFNQGTCSASIQTSTFDLVVVGTAINDAGGCGLPVAGFTTITTNKGYGGWFEVDYTITSVPQTTVMFNCNGTDAIAIVMDAISFHGAFGIR